MTEFDSSAIANPVITFGKHAGTKLSDIPDDYLVWLLEKAEEENLNPRWLNTAVKREWDRRKPNSANAPIASFIGTAAISAVLANREACGCELWLIIANVLHIKGTTYRGETKGVELNYCKEHEPK